MRATLPAKTFIRGLDAMAWPAQAFEIGIIIGAAVGFGFYMVYGLRLNRTASPQTVLAEMLISVQHACPSYVPLTAIPALVAAFALLMLLPAFIAMVLTEARAMCGCASTTALPACSWG